MWYECETIIIYPCVSETGRYRLINIDLCEFNCLCCQFSRRKILLWKYIPAKLDWILSIVKWKNFWTSVENVGGFFSHI